MILEVEQWKPISGYENKYEVSNYGRVKSFKYDERILKTKCKTRSYQNVVLRKNKESKSFYIHDLVAKHFLLEEKGDREVNHIDGNKNNNHIENLEYISHKDNMKHAWKNNMFTCKRPINQLTLDGKYIKTFNSIADACRVYSKNNNPFCSIRGNLRGNSKSSYGYIWKYREEVIK